MRTLFEVQFIIYSKSLSCAARTAAIQKFKNTEPWQQQRLAGSRIAAADAAAKVHDGVAVNAGPALN